MYIGTFGNFRNILYLGIVGTKDYRKPDWVTQLEERKAKKKGNDDLVIVDCVDTIDTLEEDLTDDSSCNPLVSFPDDNTFYDFSSNTCVPLSPPLGLESFPPFPEYGTKEPNSYKMNSSFHYLPPIEESSEPSSGGSSKSNTFSGAIVLPRACSCQDMSNNDIYDSLSDSSQSRCQTFPKRSKSQQRSRTRNLTENRTLYPLEPRELDPATFFQLHMADSQEELQEFLLLESQCMSSENGISAAFLASDNSGNRKSGIGVGLVWFLLSRRQVVFYYGAKLILPGVEQTFIF